MAQLTCPFCKEWAEPIPLGFIEPRNPVSLELKRCPKCGATLEAAINAAGIATRLGKLEQELKRLSDKLASHSH